MKFGKLLSIDYKASTLLTGIIISIIMILFGMLLLSLFAESHEEISLESYYSETSSKSSYIPPSGSYDESSILVLIFFFIALFIFTMVCFLIRIKNINKILKHGIVENMEIIDFFSFKQSKDHWVCILNYNGKNIKTVLKVSKKNKSTLEEYCKIGNTVPVGFIENKMKNVILIELYKD